MRLLVFFLALSFTTVVYGQNENFDTSDSLELVKLNFDILDSNQLKELKLKRVDNYPNIMVSAEVGQTNIAYYKKDKNAWTSVLLPFNEDVNSTGSIISVETNNLDGKGEKEIIVRVDDNTYGTGMGAGKFGMVILNIDSVPTQIFKVFYGCMDESFGDKKNDGKGGYYKEYKRQFKIVENQIIISTNTKRRYAFKGCELTTIPSGTYVMSDGKIRRKPSR